MSKNEYEIGDAKVEPAAAPRPRRTGRPHAIR